MSNHSSYGGQPPYQGPPQQYGPQYGGPPPGGAQFGWGPGGFQQPPKKKGKAAWIAVPVVLVFAGIVGLWIAGLVAKQHDYTTQPTYTPSYNPNNPPTEARTDEPSTTAPTYHPRVWFADPFRKILTAKVRFDG